MGVNMSSIVHMDSNLPLRPFKNDLSAHPYLLSYKNSNDSEPHFFGENSTHLLPYTCLSTNGDVKCPLVITLLVEEDMDIIIRATEPHYPRPKYQTLDLIR
jgi:hypothetical protein